MYFILVVRNSESDRDIANASDIYMAHAMKKLKKN